MYNLGFMPTYVLGSSVGNQVVRIITYIGIFLYDFNPYKKILLFRLTARLLYDMYYIKVDVGETCFMSVLLYAVHLVLFCFVQSDLLLSLSNSYLKMTIYDVLYFYH